MSLEPKAWKEARVRLQDLLSVNNTTLQNDENLRSR